MSSAENRQAAFERAARTAFVTLGVAGLSSFLTSEGVADFVWPVVGAALISFGLSTLIRRGVESLARNPVARLFGVYSVTFPALAGILLAVLPTVLVLSISANITLHGGFIIVGVVTALASIANFVVMILNIDLIRSGDRAQ